MLNGFVKLSAQAILGPNLDIIEVIIFLNSENNMDDIFFNLFFTAYYST
ncbi:hypothetical protein NARC_50110 [Candidatus Nitrosocosmicus arcticus]|uniref:Uncharacterized protein n=1 Tax=Candidatus Nitrosocosmicus arcticus TaxID=2035267 RepID=A0A557SWF1_9ARCH|nr:hypothetical protein NARC_50110 [Candidatus Nitrosocosmicus arcticus]